MNAKYVRHKWELHPGSKTKRETINEKKQLKIREKKMLLMQELKKQFYQLFLMDQIPDNTMQQIHTAMI